MKILLTNDDGLRAPAPVDPGLSEDGGAPHPVVAYAVAGTPGGCCVVGLESVVGAVDNPQFDGAGRLLRLLAHRLSQAPARAWA